MSDYILETHKLSKHYGKTEVLKEISLSVPKGSIYGLIGENGAGKTTLFRILSGLSHQTSGTFSILGVTSENDIKETRRDMGVIVEEPALYPNLTVIENMYIQQLQYFGKRDCTKANEILELVGLHTQNQKKAKKLSLGMKQRLAIALVLINSPKLLLLDEPVNGLDPMGIIEFRKLLLMLNRENNVTIILSSHILNELECVATHYGFLHKGNLIKETLNFDISQSAESLEQYYEKMLEECQ